MNALCLVVVDTDIFIHSFIPDIYIAPIQETYSESLSVQLRSKRNVLRSLQKEDMLLSCTYCNVSHFALLLFYPCTFCMATFLNFPGDGRVVIRSYFLQSRLSQTLEIRDDELQTIQSESVT